MSGTLGHPGLVGPLRLHAGRVSPLEHAGIPPAQPPSPATGNVLMMVAGQSNSRTAGNSSSTPAAKYTAAGAMGDTYILVQGAGGVSDAAFVPYDITANADPDNTGTAWGSEAEAVWQMRQAGDTRPVYIVKESINGQNLAVQWSPGTTGDKFDRFDAKVDRARALVTDGFGEEVLFWNQGEADATNDTWAAAYGTNWTAWLSAFRSRVSATALVVAERIRPLGYATGSSVTATAGYVRAWAVREGTIAGCLADGNATVVDTDFDTGNFGSIHPGEPWTEGKGLRAYAAWQGTYASTYGTITDTVPAAFDFADVTGATPERVVVSGGQLVTGIERQAPVSITGGEWRTLNSLDGDSVVTDWTSGTGFVDKFQRIQARLTAPSGLSATGSLTLTVGGVDVDWSVTTYAGAPSFEAETTAFIDRVSTNGGGSISGADADALDAFYAAAKATTWWPKIKRLYLRLGDETASRLDLAGQTVSMSNTGLPAAYWTWTAATGWTGQDNSNGGLDLNFDPATGWGQEGAAFGLWYAAVASNTRGELHAGSETFLRVLSNSSRYLLNSAVNTNQTGMSNAPGLYAVVRDGATSIRLHGPNGAVRSTGTAAAVAPASTRMEIGNSGGTHSDANVLGAFVATAALSEAEIRALAAAAGALQDRFAP